MPERLVDVEKEGAKVLDTFLLRSAPPLWKRRRSRRSHCRRRATRSCSRTRNSRV